MRWIALTGGPGAGKTTLADELVRLGYLRINFTDLLKDLAVDALATCMNISKADILADKDRYRPFLIAFGHIIGFDTDPGYIDCALEEWEQRGQPPAVFDNVRFDPQANYLIEKGFSVVEISTIPPLYDSGIKPISVPRRTFIKNFWQPNDLAMHIRDV